MNCRNAHGRTSPLSSMAPQKGGHVPASSTMALSPSSTSLTETGIRFIVRWNLEAENRRTTQSSGSTNYLPNKNKICMTIRNRTTKTLKGPQITGRGATPAIRNKENKPQRGGRVLCRPFRACPIRRLSRGCTPACGLNSPSGFAGGAIANNHLIL